MSASTKLSTSVKALCILAQNPEQSYKSEAIAEEIGVNSSKLRKLLSMLVKNNILASEYGNKGGFRLVKSASEIDLQEIYCAIEDRKAFHLHVSESDNKNLTARFVNSYFLDLFTEIQVDIENKMKNLTLSDIIDQSKKYKS